MWQQFSECAKITVFYAQEQAKRFGTIEVSTEHLLLGLLHQVEHSGVWPPPPVDRIEAGDAARFALREMGVDIAAVRADMESRTQIGKADPLQDRKLSQDSKRVIDLSYKAARSLSHGYIGTEHLLLGLISEENGSTGRVLKQFGVGLEPVRALIAELPPTSRAQAGSQIQTAQASFWSRVFKRPTTQSGEKSTP